MRLAVKLVAATVFAGVAGVATAHMMMGGRAIAITAGGTSWQSWQAQSADGDPYVIARFLMSGRLPPARSQISEFETDADGKGELLESGCIYRIALKPDGWRWWSLAIPSGRAISSDTAVADADGTAPVVLAPSPRPGNWLATPGGRFRLVLRVQSGGATPLPPAVAKEACP